MSVMKQEREMSIEQRACQVWAVLVFAASRRYTLTYSELEKATGFIRAGFGKILKRIQRHCHRNKLPNLSSLVVNEYGAPSDGCVRDYEEEGWEKTWDSVYQHDWLAKRNPGKDSFREAK